MIHVVNRALFFQYIYSTVFLFAHNLSQFCSLESLIQGAIILKSADLQLYVISDSKEFATR